MCLAQIMVDLARAKEWRLVVGHCDHRWRQDSEANAEHVEGGKSGACLGKCPNCGSFSKTKIQMPPMFSSTLTPNSLTHWRSHIHVQQDLRTNGAFPSS